jgi:hypothetical protein
MGNCIARRRLAEGRVRISSHEVVAAAGPRSPILVGRAFLTLGPRLEQRLNVPSRPGRELFRS